MTKKKTFRTWVYSELATETMLNEQIRDNGNAMWVYDAAGQIAVSSASDELTKLEASGSGNKRLVSNGSTFELISDEKYFTVLINTNVALTSGDDSARIRIPPALDGWKLNSVGASRKSGTGVPIIQIRNVSTGNDMLSTRLRIDTSETDSATAATPAVIDATYKAVSSTNQLAIDVDDAGTGTYYLIVQLGFVRN